MERGFLKNKLMLKQKELRDSKKQILYDFEHFFIISDKLPFPDGTCLLWVFCH